MDVELAEVRRFLAEHEPYRDLPEHLLDDLPGAMESTYFRRGSQIIAAGARNDYVHVLRSGVVDIIDSLGMLADRGETGFSFGLSSVLTGGPSLYRVVALEDTLCYLIDADRFRYLMSASGEFAEFFMRQQVGHIGRAVPPVEVMDPGSAMLRTRIRQVLRRAPVTAPLQTTVGEAARIMSAERISALLITDEERLRGIFTDRDIRARVLAPGLAKDTPVAEVMTPDPITLPSDRLTVEALAELTQHGLHHVPVVDDGDLLGMVTAGDLMRLARDNPTLLLGEIAEQTSVRGLAAVIRRLPQVVRSAAGAHTAPADVARLITSVADSVTRRLLRLAEEALGPAPMRYCWVVLGSQGRMEMGLHSDQDTALILAREPDAEEATYFSALAQQVVDGLAECGYPRCPGDVMATNPRWRVDVDTWRAYFDNWITEPEPEALLNAQIFFDMRPVSGNRRLYERVHQVQRDRAPDSEAFLAHLARAAQRAKPPLGFFRGLVLERSGAERRTLDVKAGALAQITQIARLSALALGKQGWSTPDRLAAAAGSRVLSAERAADLSDAHEFLTGVRTRHHVRQIDQNQPLDSKVHPADLSPFERRHLKNAFAVVRRAQSALPYLYRIHALPPQ